MYSYLVKPRRMGQRSDSPQDPIGSPDKKEKRLEIGGMRWLSGFSRSIASVDCVLILILIQELQSKCSISAAFVQSIDLSCGICAAEMQEICSMNAVEVQYQ